MVDLIRANQLNIMLVLCGACIVLAILLINTRFLSKSRKAILFCMELMASLLLWFDRAAYIYAGDPSHTGFVMVRLSNFMVFFLTPAIVFGFNLFIADLVRNEGKQAVLPKRLVFVGAAAGIGMLMAIIAAFTDLYYYFDGSNLYHRGSGFLIAYIIPVICPFVQFTVIWQYRKKFGRLIFISLLLYVFGPLFCGILQIFTYGISIVNMAMVVVSISLYFFLYADLNNTVKHAHEIEIQNIEGEKIRMQRLFDQTATAFVQAVEKKDEFTKGNSVRIAGYAKKIAELAGKSGEDCEKVYYAALLHDVGLIGIPDQVIKNNADPTKEDYEAIRKKPAIGSEILSSITEYPYLSEAAHSSHERFNGTGYPEGLKGEEIPEIARIVAVADAYITMTTRKRYRDARPDFVARETFIKEAGASFDPVFANLMVKIIDSKAKGNTDENALPLEKELECRSYRETVSTGIHVDRNTVRISFDCDMPMNPELPHASPSIILFDSYDGRMHDSEKAIESYHYSEYGEIWFDQYSITTTARKIEEKRIEDREASSKQEGTKRFEILAGRYEDHLKLVMRSETYAKEVIVALPSRSKAAFIALTGENCRLKNIQTEPTGDRVGLEDIQKIVKPLSFIDHLEADVPNVQIDRSRSAYSEGIELKNRQKLSFHTMSLPGSDLIWHCPYIILYSAADGKVNGENYREYAFIKLNGEDEVAGNFARNRFIMEKTEGFPGWEKWKEKNRKGLDCEIIIEKRKDRIVLKTENLGIRIENITELREDTPGVYAALTGDQVALTDIRIE